VGLGVGNRDIFWNEVFVVLKWELEVFGILPRLTSLQVKREAGSRFEIERPGVGSCYAECGRSWRMTAMDNLGSSKQTGAAAVAKYHVHKTKRNKG
jgi:hypothetical protein